jgi:hypothetical protein
MNSIIIRKFVFIFVSSFIIISAAESRPQFDNKKSLEKLSWDFDEDRNEAASLDISLSEILVPQLIIDTKQIRQYILDERFQKLRNRDGDLRAIDAVYLKSLQIAEHNVARALFLSMMAVLDHRGVYIKIPIIKYIDVPLTFERDSIFSLRVSHLPSRIYSDTLNTPAGDADKLQHFFGSAYLAYSSEAPEFAQAFGNFVEWGEGNFIIGGKDDPRDKRANKQGGSFGRDLLVVTTLLPSDYLTFSNEDSK